MTKLYFNYDELNSKVINNFIDVINKLKYSINKIDSLNLPYSFTKKQDIVRIKERLLQNKDKLEKMMNIIAENNRVYSKRHDEFIYEIGKLPILKIQTRKGLDQ